MKYDYRDYYPGAWDSDNESGGTPPQKQPKRTFSLGFLLSVVSVVTVITILMTYTLTSAAKRS